MKYFLILLFLAGITGAASAVPYQDPQYTFDNSDTVLVGTILTADIITEPVITRAENFFSETAGVAIYEIHVEEYLKNSGSDTITVAGFFTRESNAMSVHTYPYEADQRVLFYLIKNNDTNTGLQFEILSGVSRVIEDSLCPENSEFVRGICVVNDAIDDSIQKIPTDSEQRESLSKGETLGDSLGWWTLAGSIVIVGLFVIILARRKK
ncbi:hypothetical protein C6988_04520 [Nitrosopumilus sp. b1]|uniref:hypothetical protein n=1 Tax=Nitrosopumilus sp. b1 TaxID=2109907 RepID=UPI0015F6B88C|nr:hypothetical protein [Nitrosopumilus sp. b1]KAF6243198.1 hypothetical protein C6988_04520 [Nitrosopumilus sp. b1]